ncbi:MAG: GntR family transcriptional regulator, partial [Beijerinckiaceae bacterium]
MRPRDQVYTALKRRILLNELQPETVLTELGIAQDMGCSQGTVREALLRLQEDGLVMRSGHRGTTVTPLDAVIAGEMIALRRQIETRAARHAAPRIGAERLALLHTLIDEMKKAAHAGDEFALIEADMRFHLALFQPAGFQALEQILTRLMLHTHRQKLWEPRHRRSLAETAARH